MTERGQAGFVGGPVRSLMIRLCVRGCTHLWKFLDLHPDEFMCACL